MLRKLAAVLAALFLLAGCGRLTVAVKALADDTISGYVIFAFTPEQAEQQAFNADDMIAQMAGTLPDGVTLSKYSGDGRTGIQMDFQNVPMLDASNTLQGPPFQITHDGDTMTFTSTMDIAGQISQGMPSEMLDGFEATFTVIFPGAVMETNGVADGNTATFTFDPANPQDFTATGEATDNGQAGTLPGPGGGGSGGPWLWLAIGAALIVVAGAGVLWLLARRRAQAVGANAPGGATATAAEVVDGDGTDAAVEQGTSTVAHVADDEPPEGYEPSVRPEDL